MVRLAIATPNLNIYSETFIRSHIERLPGVVTVLYGGIPPNLIGNGDRIVPDFTLGRHIRWSIEFRLRRLTWNDRYRRYLIKALRRFNVDVVLAEFGQMGVSMMDACQEAGIPLAVHFHGIDAYKFEILEEYGHGYRNLFNIAYAIIVSSHDMFQQLLHLGAPHKKVHLNLYGVDELQFYGANPAQAPPVFLAASRFVDKKGPLLTLLAFQKVQNEVPEARLIMIGEGPLLEMSKQLVRALGFEQAVDFPGAVTHQELAMAMRGARTFVQHSLRPSDGDSEGTPVVVLEASASGLPVVSTRHAGIPEVVIDGRTGFLVDEGDVDGMARVMIKLIKNPDLAEKMGLEGQMRFQKCFSMNKSIGNLWKIITASKVKAGA